MGAEAALGKRGLSTCLGTSAQGVDRWHLCRWGGVGEAAGVYVYFTKEKKKMDEMVSFPLSSFFFLNATKHMRNVLPFLSNSKCKDSN